MRIRDWDDIIQEVADADVDPTAWRAVAGTRANGVGEDLYLSHPSEGVYQLKTYAKNPFDVKGVGSKVARSIDEDIAPLFPDEGDQRFAVQTAPTDEAEAERIANRVTTVLETHAEAPTSPDALFADVMEALDAPAYGPLDSKQQSRSEEIRDLSTTFEEAEELLDAELSELIEADEVGKGFY